VCMPRGHGRIGGEWMGYRVGYEVFDKKCVLRDNWAASKKKSATKDFEDDPRSSLS